MARQTLTNSPSAAAGAREAPLPLGGPGHEFLGSALAQARRGDRDALTYLYIRYGDEVAREIQRLAGDASAAETITEQLFAELPTTLPADASEVAKFDAWILRRAREAAQAPPPSAS